MKRSEVTPLWNVASNSLSSTSSTIRASRLKRVIKDRRLSFFPCSMVNRLDEKRLCLYPLVKLLTNNLLNSSKELTELRGYLAKPHSCRPFEGGWKGSAHYLFRNPLKVHCSFESCNVVKRVTHSIVWIQRGHLELWRERVTIDECSKRGVSPMNSVLYRICPFHIFSHLIHLFL